MGLYSKTTQKKRTMGNEFITGERLANGTNPPFKHRLVFDHPKSKRRHHQSTFFCARSFPSNPWLRTQRKGQPIRTWALHTKRSPPRDAPIRLKAFLQHNPRHVSKTIQGICPRQSGAFIQDNSGYFSQRIGGIYPQQFRAFLPEDWKHLYKTTQGIKGLETFLPEECRHFFQNPQKEGQ